MGIVAKYYPSSSKYKTPKGYIQIGETEIVNGVTGFLVKKIGDSDTHTNLPLSTISSNMYFRKDVKGVCQARVYVGHKLFLDFDWSHNHKNADGRIFKVGHVHVQIWNVNKDGTFSRQSASARSMSPLEMKKYGPILKKFCPMIKLR